MTYNITEVDGVTNNAEWFVNISNATGGVLGTSIIVILWIAFFIYGANRNLDPGESFLMSSFVNAIIASLFYFAKLVNLEVVVILLVMTFAGLLYKTFK